MFLGCQQLPYILKFSAARRNGSPVCWALPLLDSIERVWKFMKSE